MSTSYPMETQRTLQVESSLLNGGEDTGRLDNNLGTISSPWDQRGVLPARK